MEVVEWIISLMILYFKDCEVFVVINIVILVVMVILYDGGNGIYHIDEDE